MTGLISVQIAQDDEGFEIASIRDSLDEEDGPADHPPSYDPVRPQRDAAREASPLPAPQAQKPIHPPRESLDGDTIFAVGEDDKWSDDNDDLELASPKGSDDGHARLISHAGQSRKDD